MCCNTKKLTHWSSLLFFSDVFQPIQRGDRFEGFVKNVREDQKLDLSLQKSGYEQVTDTAEWLITFLRENDGFLPLTDKSPPEEIYKTFGVSKKIFKKAAGRLYREKRITISSNGLTYLPFDESDVDDESE
mgnify:CR=1 FL=1